MTSPGRDAFSFRLLDPTSLPNYYTTTPAVGAVIQLIGISFWLRPELSKRAGIVTCIAPALVGCLASVIQTHLLVLGLMRDWMGTGALFEESIFYSLYSTHIGIYGSIVILLLFAIRHVNDRRKALHHVVTKKAHPPYPVDYSYPEAQRSTPIDEVPQTYSAGSLTLGQGAVISHRVVRRLRGCARQIR